MIADRSLLTTGRASLLAGVVAALVLAAALAPDARAHTLGFTAAKRAAQARADSQAGQPTRITTLSRLGLSGHVYWGFAEWNAPRDIGGGVFVDEYHLIQLQVRCLGRHNRFNARRPCRPFAWVTDVHG